MKLMMNYSLKATLTTRSRNYFCRGKAIGIIYSECVSVALDKQYGKRMRIIYGLEFCREIFRKILKYKI
jgi:hypothetical protein